jgi:hypothetical protein
LIDAMLPTAVALTLAITPFMVGGLTSTPPVMFSGLRPLNSA